MLLVIDSRYFDGTIITSMRDDVHSDYSGETLDDLQNRHNNSHLISVTPERVRFLLRRYYKALCYPFAEITAECYYNLLECVPPKRLHRNWFFVGEASSGMMHDLCFTVGERYFKALRSITLSDNDINKEIASFIKRFDLHPIIVKERPIRKHNCWYNKLVQCVSYYIVLNGEKHFLFNLISETGSLYDDRRYRREAAGYLLNLRKNRYEYFAFNSYKTNIFEFFKWLRNNEYTIEVQGSLFCFGPERSYVDFSGNVCEYSAVFHYRIYSRELFENIICQLRRVKRRTIDCW